MSDKLRSFPDEYRAALAEYLAGSGEAALNKAYQLGREALNDGHGVLDMATMHYQAFQGLRGAKGAARRVQIDKAAEFFAESLSPFEMAFRGYREANSHLMTLNASLRQAKAAAHIANHELEAFSYSVAHDLRAPLRGIDGFSQALLEDYGDKLDDEGKQHLRFVRESAQQMAHLIDDLLTLSRVTRSDLRSEPVDLSGLARAALAQAGKVQPDRRVEIVVADGLTAAGDARMLKAALDNLLGNAWKFTNRRAHARIEVGAAVTDAECVFFVRDNGVGFDMAHAAKLFGVFQRLHSVAEFEGTGIGLATVQRIIRRHGGRIWAESQPDQGATFHFTLGNQAPAEKDKDQMTEDKVILLVEDNPKDEALTLRALKKCDIRHEVVVVRDGAEALDYLLGQASDAAPVMRTLPQLVLLDLKLPKIDGLEVLRRIRASGRTRLLPVVILTSSMEDKDIVDGYRLGANSYVRKPVDYVEFVEAVRQLGLYWLLVNDPLPNIGDL